MVKLKLKIDCREAKIIELFQQFPEKIKGFTYEVAPLDVGDFHFLDLDDDSLFLIIERKTYPDFAASIADGRYREQKLRLLSSNALKKCYLLEAPKTINSKCRVNLDAVESAMLGTAIRDELIVLTTDNLQDTFRLLCKIAGKIGEWKCKGKATTPAIDTNFSLISTVKKDNLTPKLCYLGMLMQIPNVSEQFATTICNKYPSLVDFSKLLTIGKEQVINELSELSTEHRKIGRLTATKIANFLFENETKPKISVAVKVKTKENETVKSDVEVGVGVGVGVASSL